MFYEFIRTNFDWQLIVINEIDELKSYKRELPSTVDIEYSVK